MKRGTHAGRAIALIGLAAVVLLWLFVPGRSAAVDTGRQAAAPEQAVHDVDGRAIVEATLAAPIRTPIATESPLPPVASTADSGQLAIHGFVRDSRGLSFTQSPSTVALIDDSGERRLSKIERDRYAFDGLGAGQYTLECRVHGYESVERSVQLHTGDGIREEDLTLEAVWSLLVRIVTPAGEDVRSLLEKEGLRGPASPGVFVTLGPPSERVPADFEMDGSILTQQSFTADRDDHVQLHVDPPLYVSIVFGESVLVTQHITERVEELTFVLDLDRFRRSLAGLVVRIVDCESGVPALNANASLMSDNMTEAPTQADGQGVVRFEKRLPGVYEVWIRSKGCAMHRQIVELTPGQATDLGTITLKKGMSIRGVCVDVEGAPRQVPACLGPLADTEEGRDGLVHVRFSLRVDEAGRFSLANLAAGRYMTWVEPAPLPGTKSEGEGGWGTRPILVDTRAGPVEDLRIVVTRPVPITLRPTAAATGLRYIVITTEGLVYRDGALDENAPQGIDLVSGTYKLRLMRRRELVREIPFTVGKDPVVLDVGP